MPAPSYSYGTWQEPDDSSTTSTEIETQDSTFHEWVGHVVIISLLVAILYGFWSLLEVDGPRPFPGFGHDGHPV